MTGDDKTVRFYDDEAEKYAAWSPPKHPYPYLEKFLAKAPAGRILDFGCGGGWAAARMVEASRDVDALDGSAELATQAQRLYGLSVTVARFDEFAEHAKYAAIWAHFSLLHDVKANMPANLKRLHDALTSEGLLYLGLKAGIGERRDSLGRFYAYYEMQELSDLLTDAGFLNIDIRGRTGEAYDGAEERLWHVFAHRGSTVEGAA
jgi:SAM-dependent methyltransferase